MTPIEKFLTIGLLAHVDAGKTTLSEAMLYLGGALRRAGRVDHGDSFLDTDAIERERGITIFSKQARLTFGHTRMTLLDTPGHVDFSAEMERTLQVLDCAVLVISGTDGVQGHTRTLWRLLAHYQVPTFLFVNKTDLAGTDPDRILKELKAELSEGCVFFPASSLKEETLKEETLKEETLKEEDLKEKALKEEGFLEELAMCSDALLEEFSETAELSSASIREAVGRREIFPVFQGSALKMEGVKELLQGLEDFGPLWPGEEPGEGPCEGSCEEGAPAKAPVKAPAARIYKISRDSKGARLTFLKMTAGAISVKDSVSYPAADGSVLTEKIDQIRLYSGEKYELAGRVTAGEICAVTGLSGTMPGMGLGAEASLMRPVLEAVMTRAVLLPPDQNAALFYRTLKPLEEEDPALHIVWDEKAQEIRAQIMGQVQIEVLTQLIRERFGIEVSFGQEQILYKETLKKPAVGIGHFEPLRHYAEAQLLLEPGERGSGITVSSKCSEDVLALNWQRLITTHILECEHPGVLIGAPVTDLKISILTGRSHIKHTEGGDFRQATYRAIRQGLMSGESVLLEPFYHFLLEIPSECIGRALNDLSQMHAKAGDPEICGDRAKLEGRVPVSAVGSYVTEVRAYTRGSGSLSLTPDGYDPCLNAEEVIAAAGYDPDADLEHPAGSVFCSHGAGFVVPWEEVPAHAHCETPHLV